MADVVRLPVQFALYPGDQRSVLEPRKIPVPDPDHPFGFRAVPTTALGPNTIGELLYPVTAEYDEESHTTRVGFSYIADGLGA